MNNLKFEISIDGKKLTCFYIQSTAFADKAIAKLLANSRPCLGFDIETGKKEQFKDDPVAGLCPYRSFPSLLQFYDGIDTVYMFDCYYIPLQYFQPIFDARRLIAHHAIFDAQHIIHGGIQNLKIDCSMIMYNLVRCAEYASIEEEENGLEEEWQGYEGEGQLFDWLSKGDRHGASLRTCVAKLLGIRVDKDLQTSNWSQRPISKEQIIYAAKDAYFTYEIGVTLSRRLSELGLNKIYKLNRQAIYPVVDMILNGSMLDVEKHIEDCKEWARKKDGHEVQVLKHFKKLNNINSTVQISRWLEKHLPLELQQKWPRSEKTGHLKSDARTLDVFRRLPFVEPLLEYKKLEKMLSTYGPGLIEKLNPVTGRLHGSFTLGYTSTGRLSSRSPNLQNLPRDGDIRGIFRARDAARLVCADYGQIELRVAAEFSQDARMLRTYREGGDLHRATASSLTGKKPDRVSKEDRQLAKAINFGLLFGLGAKGLVDYARWNFGVQLSEKEGYEHYKTFFDTYAGYASWQKVTRDECEKTGVTTTAIGKVRRLIPAGMYTRSVNHPIQGSAAEVVITALCRLQKQLRKSTHVKLINCVHDEILLEAEDGYLLGAKDLLKQEMTKALLDVFPKASTKNLIDVKDGMTWQEAKN